LRSGPLCPSPNGPFRPRARRGGEEESQRVAVGDALALTSRRGTRRTGRRPLGRPPRRPQGSREGRGRVRPSLFLVLSAKYPGNTYSPARSPARAAAPPPPSSPSSFSSLAAGAPASSLALSRSLSPLPCPALPARAQRVERQRGGVGARPLLARRGGEQHERTHALLAG